MSQKSAHILAGERKVKQALPVVAILNRRWRVIDDPLQWILQVRKGRARVKASGWLGIAFCMTRTALLRNIYEHCGPVDQNTMALIYTLPEWHPDRKS